MARHSRKEVGTGDRDRFSDRLLIERVEILRADDRLDSQHHKEIVEVRSHRMDNGYYELRLTSEDAETVVRGIAIACGNDDTRRKMAEQILPLLTDFAFLQTFQAALKNRKLKITQDGTLNHAG